MMTAAPGKDRVAKQTTAGVRLVQKVELLKTVRQIPGQISA
jgi:hypothetical protein